MTLLSWPLQDVNSIVIPIDLLKMHSFDERLHLYLAQLGTSFQHLMCLENVQTLDLWTCLVLHAHYFTRIVEAHNITDITLTVDSVVVYHLSLTSTMNLALQYLNSPLVVSKMLALTSLSLNALNCLILAFPLVAQSCQTTTAQVVLFFVFAGIRLSLIFSSCLSFTSVIVSAFSALLASSSRLFASYLGTSTNSVFAKIPSNKSRLGSNSMLREVCSKKRVWVKPAKLSSSSLSIPLSSSWLIVINSGPICYDGLQKCVHSSWY